MLFLTWIFIILIITFAFLVVATKNAITSVLFLIGVYIFTSFLFIILGAEFLSVILVIIYVGAVAILFIFVIMMLNIRVVEVYNTLIHYLPVGVLIAGFYFVAMVYMINLDSEISYYTDPILTWFDPKPSISGKSNLNWLCELLYNEYPHLLWMAGLILLLAMIGAISLTIDVDARDTLIASQSVYSNVYRLKNTLSFWGPDKKLIKKIDSKYKLC